MTDRHRARSTRGVAWLATVACVGVVAALGATGASARPVSPLCFATAGGTINGDSFGGRAASRRDGSIEGNWTHATRDGLTFTGRVDRLSCTPNGGNPERPTVFVSIADLSGSGFFGGHDVTFSVHLEDDGEPGGALEVYQINIFDEGGRVIYTTGGRIESGNIQVHPTNPGHP